MKIILQQDVPGTGKRGEVREVTDGYARNFLLPKRLALPATDGNLKLVEAEAARKKHHDQEVLKSAQALAAQLEAIMLKFALKKGRDGKFFGAITAKQLSSSLQAEHQLQIDRKKIILKGGLKQLGITKVAIKLHPKVKTAITVELVEEE
ncbi:MAG: hypothetical protein RLZ12_318 [Bacillota bacterium]|jgi:large subunit ribosomal protein L9